MARNKNSTALFDVIHSAKRPPKPSPSASIPTPKWWGKGKKVPKQPVVESSENVGKQRSWLSAAKKNGATPITPALPAETLVDPFPTDDISPVLAQSPDIEITHVEPAEPQAIEPVPTVVAPRPRFIDRFKNRPAAQPAFQPVDLEEQASVAPGVLAPAMVAPTMVAAATVDTHPVSDPIAAEIKAERPARRVFNDRDPVMSVDSAAGDIRFRLSYAGLVAIGFIFVLLLAIAFIAGKQVSSQTALDDSGFSDALGSTQPTTAPTAGLMIGMGPTDSAAQRDSHDSHDLQNLMPVRSDVLSLQPHAAKSAASNSSSISNTPALPIKATRDIGMVYVVVQSYAEQDLAQKACDFMNHAGLACSLVQGPAHWAPGDWYSVVGLQPFTKHDPSLADYERAIRALGVKFTNRPIDQFQPSAYTWRDDSDMAPQ